MALAYSHMVTMPDESSLFYRKGVRCHGCGRYFAVHERVSLYLDTENREYLRAHPTSTCETFLRLKGA